MSSGFGARATFVIDASHVSPHGVLNLIPLIGYVVGVVVSRAYDGYEAGFPLCFLAVTTLSWA